MFLNKIDFSIAYIAVEMEAGAILPMRLMDTDLDCWNPGSPDAAVSGLYYSGGEPTPDILVCPE